MTALIDAVQTSLTLKDAAIAYTRPNGTRPPLAIFPVIARQKKPCVSGGFREATTDRTQVSRWWAMWPDANIGFWPQNIVVLDVDTHDPAKDGRETLRNLEREFGELPETWQVLTPSGGVHFYFRCDDPRITAGTEIAPGIDYRGAAGYVLLPPSVHPNGGVYEWEAAHMPNDTPLAPLPEWLHKLILEKSKRNEQTELPETITAGTRNEALFRKACAFRRMGMTDAEINETLSILNQSRCVPPLLDAEIATIAASAAKYERGEIAPCTHHIEQGKVFEAFGFYSVPELSDEEKKPPDFIVDGMIPCGMTFLSGAPKTRKSFLALQLAIAVARGQPFFGKQTSACDVVYLDLEGSKSRISSRASRMTSEIPSNVYVTNRISAKLSDGLVDMLRDLHRERPSIRLIIIDTYSRARGQPRGGGANAYDQDVAFLEPIQQMAVDENIAILFVHHDRKGAGLMSDSFERLSGTMGISGSADCVMNLVTDGKRFEGKATLEITPRDAAGCELKLAFDNRFGEWTQLVEMASDLSGNPVCNWLLANRPDAKREGVFYPYDFIYSQAYRAYSEKPSEVVREQIMKYRDELFSSYLIGVQLGVKSNGNRGIRLVNLA